jgi:hypothetical protein
MKANQHLRGAAHEGYELARRLRCSLFLVLFVNTAAATERVNLDSLGNEAVGGQSFDPAISGDGRFVAFDSTATNLVANDTNGLRDVFVHDRQTGITQRISVDSNGNQALGGGSGSADISSDGRYVVFSSDATNLVAGDSNGQADVFLHDRQTGETLRVSVNSLGNQATGGGSHGPRISGNNQFIAFSSGATNLVTGDTNGQTDIFVHDLVAGTTERISVDSSGTQTTGTFTGTSDPAISFDGRYVAYESVAANLVPGDTNGERDIFLRDRVNNTTERVSIDSAGNQANLFSENCDISKDGRFVSFSTASILSPADGNTFKDVYVRDRQTGTTELASIGYAGNAGSGPTSSYTATISGDGRYVVFESSAPNFVPGDINGVDEVFVRDRMAGTTRRVATDSVGRQVRGAGAFEARISSDGAHITFYSFASNLVPNDGNNVTDVFVNSNPPAQLPNQSLAQTAYRAPGALDLFFGSPVQSVINGEGQVLFESSLAGAGAAKGKTRGLFSTLAPDGGVELLMQRGDEVSGLVAGAASGVKITALTAAVANQPDRGLFLATMAGPGISRTNNRALFLDNGDALQSVFRTGAAIPELGGAEMAAVSEVSQHSSADLLAVNYLLKPGTAGVTRSNDSGLLMMNHAGSVTSFGAREQQSAFGGGGEFGQFSGRAAAGIGGSVFFISKFIPSGEKPLDALFFSNANGTTTGRYGFIQGENAPTVGAGPTYRAFLAASARSSGAGLLRATLAGAPAAQNDGIWDTASGLLLRKGDAVADGLTASRIIRFWPAGSSQLLVLAQLSGTGVTRANNVALLLRQANDAWLVLLRTGDAAPGRMVGRVRSISAVDVDPINGHYVVLGTLSGVPASANQVLWLGRTTLGSDSFNQTLRLPQEVLRKGSLYQSSTTPSGRILGLTLKTSVERSGAGGRGLGQTVGSDGSVVVTVLGDRRTRDLVVIRP